MTCTPGIAKPAELFGESTYPRSLPEVAEGKESANDLLSVSEEPPQGFEPWTPALRKLCSTAELRRQRCATGILGPASIRVNSTAFPTVRSIEAEFPCLVRPKWLCPRRYASGAQGGAA